MVQHEITQPGSLLCPSGSLSQVGWSRQPLLDCNLENARSTWPRNLQRFRLKRWDYYAVFTPQRFFSATIADLGYAGNIFVYILDFQTGELHEEGLVIPLSKGIRLGRNSTQGDSCLEDERAQLAFRYSPGVRQISVCWPSFHNGRGIQAKINLYAPPEHESMTIVIPIGRRHFYYNQKINCMPAEGLLQYGELQENLQPDCCTGSLDWGRGVWDYRSFWNWASASGFLPDGRTVGLNLGCGFGNTSAATENCLILNGRIHKLEEVQFFYDVEDYQKPWVFQDSQGRLDLSITPFKERVARTNLGLIFSEVHQMFGHYSGKVLLDDGEQILLEGLTGFAEEHKARW